MSGAPQTEPLFCVTGVERSGTIWLTRLLADALDIQSRTRDFPYDDYEKDPAVWGLDRDAPFIRRLHDAPSAYKFTCPVVLAVRDPRDVAVSQVHFYNRNPNVHKEFDPHFAWLIGQWGRFYTEWFDTTLLITYIRYEELRKNTYGELAEALLNIAHVTDRLPSPQETRSAIAANEFSIMENWAKRKGTVGEWRTTLDRKRTDRIMERARARYPIITELGY